MPIVNALFTTLSDLTDMMFFAIHGSELLGRRIAAIGRFRLSPVQEFRQPSGTGLHPLHDVNDQDVFILQGLKGRAGDTQAEITERMFGFVRSCHAGGARTITVIDPFMTMRPPNSYASRDWSSRPPIDSFVTLDHHSGFSGVPVCDNTIVLSISQNFVRRFALDAPAGPLVILTGRAIDRGFVDRFRDVLIAETHLPADLVRTYQLDDVQLKLESANPDVFQNATALIIDEQLADDDRLIRMARIARTCGAIRVEAYTTHNLHPDTRLANVLAPGHIDRLTITDSINRPDPKFPDQRIQVLSCARLFADLVMDKDRMTTLNTTARHLGFANLN